MKKIFLLSILLITFSMNAQIWNVTTTCGVIGQINVADNATVQQLTDAIATYNYVNCGFYPTKVRILSAT